MAEPRILCISLSPIVRDARVLRQISVLREFGEVTTVGYGPKPDSVASHIEVPARLPSLPQTIGGVALLALRRWRRSELSAPAISYALAALRGQTFDVVVANDARVLALAHAVAGPCVGGPARVGAGGAHPRAVMAPSGRPAYAASVCHLPASVRGDHDGR